MAKAQTNTTTKAVGRIMAIKSVIFGTRVCVQMLRLDVNWDTYGVHIKNGRDTIQIDKRYANFNGDDIAARFDEIVNYFNELTTLKPVICL